MSIASYSISEAAVAALSVTPPAGRKVPRKRSIIAKADSTEFPEPR